MGRVFIRVELPPYSNLATTEKRLAAIQDRLLAFSDLDHVMTTVGIAEAFGGQAREGVYMGQIELFFKSKLERDWTIQERSRRFATCSRTTDCLISAPSWQDGGQSPSSTRLHPTRRAGGPARTIRDAGRQVPGVGMFETTVRDPAGAARRVR